VGFIFFTAFEIEKQSKKEKKEGFMQVMMGVREFDFKDTNEYDWFCQCCDMRIFFSRFNTYFNMYLNVK